MEGTDPMSEVELQEIRRIYETSLAMFPRGGMQVIGKQLRNCCGSLLGELDRLRAENAQLRSVVEEIVALRDREFPGDWSGYDFDEVNEIREQARAVLEAKS